MRRTFAALLRDPLKLRGIPRNQTKPERFANFALSEKHDTLLTKWMNGHLEIAVWSKPPACTVLGDIEEAFLQAWCPPLNLRHNQSTWKTKVSTARRVMADDARTWARESGHKV